MGLKEFVKGIVDPFMMAVNPPREVAGETDQNDEEDQHEFELEEELEAGPRVETRGTDREKDLQRKIEAAAKEQ